MLTLCLFLVVVFSPGIALGAAEEQKSWPKSSLTRLSILPFTAEQKEDKNLGERIAEELEVLLGESGRFRILMRSEMTLEERNRLLKIQVEQGRNEERAPFQHLSCEEAFISGSIRRESEGALIIYLYAISLETGEKVVGLRSRIWHENALDRIARAFAREIVKRVDIGGEVVHVDGERVFVSLQRGSEGVKKDDLLEVRHPPRLIKGAQGRIESGEERPFTTLVVETVTGSGHVQCTVKDPKGEKPQPGDRVRLIPVCPIPTRELTCAVLPFSVSDNANDQFGTLIQQELLVSGGTVRGMAISNPPGLQKYAQGDADSRLICDALGVDAVLRGTFLLLEKELRGYVGLLIHLQSEEYQEEKPSAAQGVLSKRVTVPIAGKDALTPATASKVAGAILKAFPPPAQQKKKER